MNVKKRTNTKSGINQKIMLDVGCGFNKQHGFIGMDKRKVDGIDIVHDAEVIPWPLDDKSCSVVVMSHVIEHIKPWLRINVMNEIHRILDDEGILLISTPHAQSFGAAQDPTHIHCWNEATPSYFTPGHDLYNIYQPKPWKIERIAWDIHANLEVAFRKLNEID